LIETASLKSEWPRAIDLAFQNHSETAWVKERKKVWVRL
jgi:hypothetical protein